MRNWLSISSMRVTLVSPPDVVVQYHEWSLPFPATHFIQFAHFSKILAFSYAFVKYIFLCIILCRRRLPASKYWIMLLKLYMTQAIWFPADVRLWNVVPMKTYKTFIETTASNTSNMTETIINFIGKSSKTRKLPTGSSFYISQNNRKNVLSWQNNHIDIWQCIIYNVSMLRVHS